MNFKGCRIIILSVLSMFIFGGAQAQYLQDVLRFSSNQPGSTARFKAIGNAQTSLGGDISSIAGNPAGLGFFSQSDFSVSLDFLNNINKAGYFGQDTETKLNKTGLNQIGVVFNIPSTRNRGSSLTDGWLNFNVGIGYFKNNNYNGTVGYAGTNNGSTFAHFLADELERGNTVEGNFGWDSYLLDRSEMDIDNPYYYPSVLEKDNFQKNVMSERGHHSTTNISFGSNYSNKLYLGFSLGLTSFKYDYDQKFEEFGYTKSYDDILRENPYSDFLNPDNDAYQLLEAEYELAYNYQQKNRGTGINGTFGVIYKPISQVNIGISATTPTWYSITDEATTFFDTWYFDNEEATSAYHTFNSDEVQDYIEYNLKTPYKISGGISAILGRGMISADVDYIDYGSMRFSGSDNLGSQKQPLDDSMNEDIRATYTGAVNFRVGGEYLIADNFLVRAGYGQQGSPYKNTDLSTQTISGGLGYRVNNMYLDLTYQHRSPEYTGSPYQIDTNWWQGYTTPQADIKNQNHQVFFTVGFKF